MKARPKKGRFIACDTCNVWRNDMEERTAWWHSHEELISSDDKYYFDEECGSTEIVTCQECGMTEELENLSETEGPLWECSECGQLHEDKENGDECCG